MFQELLDYDVRGFLKELASSSPAPGGGSVAALNLCLGAALVEMVCSLTIGRKKYAEVEAVMEALKAKAHDLRHDAEILVQSDTDAYNAVMAAFALPKVSDEEKKARRQAILEATRGAIRVPQKTAQQSLRLYEMALQALEYGNDNAASDALVATHLARAAGMAALANVRINLSGLKDEAEIAAYEKEINDIDVTLQQYYDRAVLLGKVRIG